ncbi:hypothetical protein PO909_025198, partial [Leuciscus waleckii]
KEDLYYYNFFFFFFINAVLFNLLFIKYIRQQFPTLIINQNIRMISRGSCDTEDWSNDP